MQNISIDIKDEEYFVLRNSIDEIKENKRILISLKRLNASIFDTEISIPFKKETKISILQELQNILEKFDYSSSLTQSVISEVENFDRENKLFEEFTKKAYSIRNDMFGQQPELIKNFEDFKKSLSSNFKRDLYLLQELSAFHLSFSQNACNFAVPGAGKTSIVYAAYSYLKNLPKDNKKHVDKLLVIGPLVIICPLGKRIFEMFWKDNNL